MRRPPPLSRTCFGRFTIVRSLASLATAALFAGSAGAEANWRSLDGHWVGLGLEIIVDTARSQARIGTEKPFQWEALQVNNITGDMIVFTIGGYGFVALFEGRQLVLTGSGFPGHVEMHRVLPPSQAGSSAEN